MLEIYYYSGTGNSLYVARELQKRIQGTELIPIIGLVNRDMIATRSETVGFIFPINLSTVPVVVRKILRKLDLRSAEYIFAVATRCGYPGPCQPHLALERLLKQKNKKLNTYFMLDMIDNSPTGLRPSYTASNSDWVNQIKVEKISQMEPDVQNKLNAIQKAIVNRENYCQVDPRRFTSRFVDDLVSRLIEYVTEKSKTEIHYYADTLCSGCGLCENICLSGKIEMIDYRPVWRKDIRCFHCYACFNYCPEQSILINNGKNSYKDKNGRYHNPAITAGDIAGQKTPPDL